MEDNPKVPLTNAYHRVFLAKPHESKPNVKFGIMRGCYENANVIVRSCPVSEGKEVIAVLKDNPHNATYCGPFISSTIPSEFEPMLAKDVILYAFVEPDMKITRPVPTGTELQKYFSHTNPVFCYMYEDGDIHCRKSVYSTEKGWHAGNVCRTSFDFWRFSASLPDNHTRIVFLENKPALIKNLKDLSKMLNMSTLQMERNDNHLESLV